MQFFMYIKKECPQCHCSIDIDKETCPLCGYTFSSAMEDEEKTTGSANQSTTNFNFCPNCGTKLSYKTFFVTKTFYQNESQMEDAFVHQISSFINDKLEYFQHFDKIIIYYDRGQKIISRILRNTFGYVFGGIVDFRTAYQKDYRLLQVADYICTLEQSRIRWNEHRPTKSERDFFLTRQIFMKNFYKKISRKHL